MNERNKIGIIGIFLILLSWTGIIIGTKNESEFIIHLVWALNFIIGYELAEKIQNLKWRGLLK